MPRRAVLCCGVSQPAGILKQLKTREGLTGPLDVEIWDQGVAPLHNDQRSGVAHLPVGLDVFYDDFISNLRCGFKNRKVWLHGHSRNLHSFAKGALPEPPTHSSNLLTLTNNQQPPLRPACAGDAVGAWYGEKMAAVLFPTAETFKQLQQLEERQPNPPDLMLIINPQWELEVSGLCMFVQTNNGTNKHQMEFVCNFAAAALAGIWQGSERDPLLSQEWLAC